MENNQINNTVCVVCGAPNDSYGLQMDTHCVKCRNYQQQLITRKAMRNEGEEQRRRENYFRHLE